MHHNAYMPGDKIDNTIMDLIFRSLDRLKINFAQFFIKLKPMLSCKITEIAMKRWFLLAYKR